jgi:hypothetical protein
MQVTYQKNVVSQLTNIAGLLLLGALSACGGGSDNGNKSSSASQTTTPATTPVVNTLAFKRMGDDYGTGEVYGYDLGGTIDASANITFTHTSTSVNDTTAPFNFTFPSGLPGGSVTATNVFSISNTAANKNIQILAPNATKFVQNVYWHNIDNDDTGGFDLPGYQVDATAMTWPSAGTAIYSGKAFQFILEGVSTPGVAPRKARTLYSSDVVATVDYAAQKVTVAIAGNPVLIESSGTPTATDPSKFASTFTFTGVNYLALAKNYSGPALTSGFGLQGGGDLIQFFGPNAEEFGGVFALGGYLSTSTTATQFISMALRKQ